MLWAHPSLVGLPCAVLLILAPGGSEDGTHDRGSTWRQPIAAMIGAVSLALLVVSGGSGSRLAAAQSAYIVLATAAFVSFVLLEPAPILRQAFRAIVTAGLASAVLIQAIWGSEAWGALGWEATRQASITMRTMVRFVSLTWPGMLALQTLAGLALAWQLYRRVAAPASTESASPPPARFRDFYMGDGWVWGIVAWLGVLILPVSSFVQVAGTNLGLVASTLYVLRGAAIVVTFAEAFGISALTLVIVAAVAAALAVPLVFVLPGLCTLGVTDTWYQYRRRLAEARERQRSNTT
jgi:hypothetical protein